MTDYDLTKMILRRPRMFYSRASTLRDVLALLHGAAVGRYPPHGTGFLPGFNEFLSERLQVASVIDYETVIAKYDDVSMPVACGEIVKLLEEWQATVKK